MEQIYDHFEFCQILRNDDQREILIDFIKDCDQVKFEKDDYHIFE